jgi:hypothetical protein
MKTDRGRKRNGKLEAVIEKYGKKEAEIERKKRERCG